MISLRVLPSCRCIGHYLKQSQLHTSVKFFDAKDSSSSSSLSAKDSSSSSSSSDSSESDSDKENQIEKKDEKKIEEQVEKPVDEFLSSDKTNERLNSLLMQITEASSRKAKEAKEVKNTADDNLTSINVALKPRQIRLKRPENQKEKKIPIEEQITKAAENVAKTIDGDAEKTKLELLSQILNLGPKEGEALSAGESKSASKDPSTESADLSTLLTKMKVESSKRKTVIHDDKRQNMEKKLKEHLSSPSVTASLLNSKVASKTPSRTVEKIEIELKGPFTELNIFKNLSKDEPQNVPRLSIWEAMDKREMKMATLTTPKNYFQEQILWTEQGKLWHFPINNEQGLEEEEKVHFSEHVFMEKHLKGWCPKKGPIKHFMELVCVGLSKNPFMTVEEKIGHINWYQQYFESKKDLLHEVGALDSKETLSIAPKEKQLEA